MPRQRSHSGAERVVETYAGCNPGARKVALKEIGMSVVRAFQAGVLENGIHEIGTIKACALEVRPNEAGFARVGAAEARLPEFAFTEV